MSASELRASARKALTGKWGKGALLVLCYLGISFGIEFILGLIPVVGQLVSLIISVPLTYGLTASFIKLKREDTVEYSGFLNEASKNFGKAWGVLGHTLKKMIVPVILVLVCLLLITFSSVGTIISSTALEDSSSVGFSGLTIIALVGYIVSLIYCTVKGLLYLLTNHILYDNPNMTSKEIVEESERLMKGNRAKYFWLELSFIGWIILSVFTLYIGLFWLVPYMEVAIVCFYEALSGRNSNEEVIVENIDNNPISE